MNKTQFDLADDARAFVGDDFYYPAYTCLESFDLGALIGVEPARNKRKIEARNALIVALLLAAWRDPDRWTAYSRDRNYYRAFNHYFGEFWAPPLLRPLPHRKPTFNARDERSDVCCTFNCWLSSNARRLQSRTE